MATVIGRKEPKIVDPNMLDNDRPFIRFKGADYTFYVQDEKVFTLNGSLTLSADNSKRDIWNFSASSEIHKAAVDAARLTVTVEDLEVEGSSDDVKHKCPDCPREFKSEGSLRSHSKFHKPRN